MGIPFYFASLIKSHKNIVKTVKKDEPLEVDVLGVDFNCLIHKYLIDDNPIQSILDSFQYIVDTICKPKKLFIALDGLVPYAKIVNQRYRRMKTKEGTGTFDRNLISPDTPFMRELEQGIKTRFPNAYFSTTQEPGEGEHKLFTEIKKLDIDQRKSVCIYGLDADLILISLINHNISEPDKLHLLRESADFNDPKLKTAEFATLSIWSLLRQLPIDIVQYTVLSILCFGNDFMPNLAVFSLREDGYNRALQMYSECGNPDLLTTEGRTKFLEYVATKEVQTLYERVLLRKRPEEKALFGKNAKLLSRKFGLHNLDGVQDIGQVVEAFWKTFHWTLYYFQNGKPLNWDWVYPYPDAPLITDIAEYEEVEAPKEGKCKFTLKHQLSFILPEASLKKTRRKTMFPDEIYSETRNAWMKRFDWEMKPRISLPWNPIYDLTQVEKMDF